MENCITAILSVLLMTHKQKIPTGETSSPEIHRHISPTAAHMTELKTQRKTAISKETEKLDFDIGDTKNKQLLKVLILL